MSLPLVELSFLDLLRGFVAVGRRMSITLAAQDLCLTQSAVSRQVNTLEERLGMPLLVRGYRSITFTPEGERLFRSADGAVQQLQDVLGALATTRAVRPVTLGASIGVAGLWLLPRLNRLQSLHPGIDLRVSASDALVDLRHQGIDLAIRYTTPARAAEGAVRLFGEAVVPVVSRSLDMRALKSARALSGLTLLEFDKPDYPWLQWSTWLAGMGWSDAKPRSVTHFNQYDQVIQAALDGQGVALGRLALVQPLIDAGRLVLLQDVSASNPAPSTHAYWLISAEQRPREAVRQVASWIEQEAQLTRQQAEAAGPLDLSRSGD